jgi:peroxiredoxin
MNSMVDEFLQLEEQTRGGKVGFSCLYHLVSNAGKVGDADLPVTIGKKKALDLLGKHYADYPDIDTMFRILVMGARIPELQSFPRTIIASSSMDCVRANAMYELANLLAIDANLPAMRASQLALLDEADPNYEIRLKRLQKSLADLRDIDSELNRREAANLIQQIHDEFPDQLVPPKANVRTPAIIEVDRGPIDQVLNSDRERLVDRIPSVQFELEHGIGQPAPLISGNDARGNPMSLADFHGKVVVLMFSFKGCGPCEAMYPDNRKLIEELKNEPFAFIGVQGDESIDTVVESIDSETITWRVWWDGTEKTISKQWNIKAWPATFVLDKNGVLRYRGLRGKELARAVELLRER